MSNTKYTIKINNSVIERVKSFEAEKNLTQYSGKFDMLISDPENTLYNTVTSGDEIEAVNEKFPSIIEEYKEGMLPKHWYKFNNMD
jgi:prophage tail gpP-like protein